MRNIQRPTSREDSNSKATPKEPGSDLGLAPGFWIFSLEVGCWILEVFLSLVPLRQIGLLGRSQQRNVSHDFRVQGGKIRRIGLTHQKILASCLSDPQCLTWR